MYIVEPVKAAFPANSQLDNVLLNFITVTLFVKYSGYATYGVPSGAIAIEVLGINSFEKPAFPTNFQDELAYAILLDELQAKVEKTRKIKSKNIEIDFILSIKPLFLLP
ncbi:hypothetical protein [Paenibacillus periandrae]|uniref:hypothetical protein n=1 Tax=Paenibacillus periandrae TaxID=1761741 RepID=UPI001F09B4DF|nr:hypothetical protein [Paenibacillus periandrae]